jgi:hypothetical protein
MSGKFMTAKIKNLGKQLDEAYDDLHEADSKLWEATNKLADCTHALKKILVDKFILNERINEIQKLIDKEQP